MIKAYLAGIPSLYEGESIEVRYSIFEDNELLSKKSIMMEYKKPAIVGQVALMTLLTELENYMDKEIVIIVNDGALYEMVRGTSTSKNKDALNMAKKTREKLLKFEHIIIKDVGGNHEELTRWDEVLKP
ncbi:MAG: hypothetical protein APF84_04145 [Gracilibacter sp. BRH_c7a]|nr:MAG: hypothetical protein APF84_04145 [Gracilibacter sp. BRH_c7a]